MERYGNIRFTRRVVSFVCLLVVAVSVLMPARVVSASTITKNANMTVSCYLRGDDVERNTMAKLYDNGVMKGSSPIYSFIIYPTSPYRKAAFDNNKVYDNYDFIMGYCSDSSFSVSGDNYWALPNGEKPQSHPLPFGVTINDSGIWYSDYCSLFGNYTTVHSFSINPTKITADIVISCDSFSTTTQFDKTSMCEALAKLKNYVKNGVVSDKMMLNVGQGYQAQDKAYSEIGCLDNVQMETYITNKKELDYADENADLSKINQDKVIVYSSTSTTGIDLSKGGYKVQLYGSYAWQDKSGNIKSEDKGHKTFIKDWKAENNIKGLNRSAYTWIDWKSANNKVEANKTSNAHKPNAFEKMTTYANYQYEPIWYLRIVSQDNKYGAWVKLYNSSKNKGNYDSDSVDDDGNKVSDSDGGYDKTKSTSEITGTGDTPEDAKDNVQKAEEKQDNKDIQDASGGSNSTFDKLEEFTKGIGDVPKMIADIFSFLPSWCLDVVAIGFALLMILIVVKFIRG